MADISQAKRGTLNRLTGNASTAKVGELGIIEPGQSRLGSARVDWRPARPNARLGLREGNKYEFKGADTKSSWVEVGRNDVQFIDAAGKSFLALKLDTLRDILTATGDTLTEAGSKYKSSADYREAQVKQYYDTFHEGNRAARNEVGSGQFRYDISKQHLADSVANELEHAAQITGLKALEKLSSELPDKNPGMECYGTALLNVLKARGLVPPSITRTEFEEQYAWIFKDLPQQSRHHMLVGGGGGALETKAILENLIPKLSNLDEWAKFTGMSQKKGNVRLLVKGNEGAEQVKQYVAEEVKKGEVVFVGVPGHYRNAVGIIGHGIRYDDPLGVWGHVLYGSKPVTFGVVIK